MRLTTFMLGSENVKGVYLDGQLQKFCQVCDTDEGWVDRYKTDPDHPDKLYVKKNPRPDGGWDGELVTERVYGKVTLEW